MLMMYSSDLSDKEWEILESCYSRYYRKRSGYDRLIGRSESSSMESFINSKMGATGVTRPKIFPPTQRFIGTIELLYQKTVAKKSERLSLQQIAALSLEERHKLISPYIAATAGDFQTDSELIEFAALDSEDWDLIAPSLQK